MKLAVWLCVYGKVIALPPLEAANQPEKVYPVRVGVPGDAPIDPPVVVEPLEIALPPWES